MEAVLQGLVGRVDPEALVAGKRVDPCWQPWRSGTPLAWSDELPVFAEPLTVARLLLSPCLAEVYCHAQTRREDSDAE